MRGYYVDEGNNGWGFQIGDYTGSSDYGMLYYFTRMGVPVWAILNIVSATPDEIVYSVHVVKGDGLPGSTRIHDAERCGTLELRRIADSPKEMYSGVLSLMGNSPLATEPTPSPRTPWPYVHRFTAVLLIPDYVPSTPSDPVA